MWKRPMLYVLSYTQPCMLSVLTEELVALGISNRLFIPGTYSV